MYGNLRFQRGTIRASSSFPADSYLIEIGGSECAGVLIGNVTQGCCNENIGIENLMLDASLVALGGLRINNTMDTVVGPHIIFLGHREAGLTIHGGHESTITHCWFGQYYVRLLYMPALCCCKMAYCTKIALMHRFVVAVR